MNFSSFFKIATAVLITITAISFSSCSEEDNNLHEPVFDASTPELLKKTTGNRVEKITDKGLNLPEGFTAYAYYYAENVEPQILVYGSEENKNEKYGYPAVVIPTCDQNFSYESNGHEGYIECLGSGTTCANMGNGMIRICGDVR